MRYAHHDPERELDQEWGYCDLCGTVYTVYEMDFENSSVQPTVAETLTGATSGTTAIVSSVSLDHGTYGAGTATGTIVVTSPSGDFTDGEYINGSVGGTHMITCRVYAPRTYGIPYPESALTEYGGRSYCAPHWRAYGIVIRDAENVPILSGEES